jgi:hypothetical protein
MWPAGPSAPRRSTVNKGMPFGGGLAKVGITDAVTFDHSEGLKP